MKDISPGEDLFNLQAADEAGNLTHGYLMTLEYVQILCISDPNNFVWKICLPGKRREQKGLLPLPSQARQCCSSACVEKQGGRKEGRRKKNHVLS